MEVWVEMKEALGELKDWDKMGQPSTGNYCYVRFFHGNRDENHLGFTVCNLILIV